MAETTCNGETYSYETGRALTPYEARQYVLSAAGGREARMAAANWKRALGEHAETSYWGVEHIRAMRGFWLGVARAIRDAKAQRDSRALAAYAFHRCHGASRVGHHAEDAIALARAEALLAEAVEAGAVEVRWEPDEFYYSEIAQPMQCEIRRTVEPDAGDVLASLCGIDLAGDDPYQRVVEAELALGAEDEIRDALSRARASSSSSPDFDGISLDTMGEDALRSLAANLLAARDAITLSPAEAAAVYEVLFDPEMYVDDGEGGWVRPETEQVLAPVRERLREKVS